MGLFKIKKKSKKEFMKYEDGKIIPVEVEQPKNYKEFNINTIHRDDEVDIKTIIKEKVDMPGKVKKYGTWKTLKIAGAIAVVIFFGFTVKDVYVAFTTPDGHKVAQVNKPTISNNKMTTTETGAYQPGSSKVGELSTPATESNGNPNTNSSSAQTGNKSTLRTAIDASNVVNSMLVSEMNKELGYLNEYFNNRLNEISLKNDVNDSIQTETQLTSFLSAKKDNFKKEGILSFYSVTEDRLNNAIDLTNAINSSFDTDLSNDELVQKVNGYIGTENTLKDKQNQVFLQLLKDKGIKYTQDTTKGKIHYTIQ